MPFVLLFIGLMLVVVSVRDNQSAFYGQLAQDFSGPNNFTTWIIAIVAIGSLGYVKPLKTPVDLFLGLMLIGFLISNKNGFEKLLPSLQNAFSSLSAGTSGGSVVPGNNGAPSQAAPAPTVLPSGASASEQSILNMVTGTDQQLVHNLFGVP